MFRLQRLAGPNRTTLRVEGRLAGRDAARLLRLELQHVVWKSHLALDLEELTFADELSLLELRLAVREGAVVHGATRLMSALLSEGGP